ncbi:flagellar hook-basal body protein [Niallia circulans]|jgi:flagellar basal-body rod protein FlgG|uniref:Flagellar basal body rod protein FlgG n=1 Tax=Niallia circulans TaxID=1397 RepID=A0A0J1LAX7_NIACI|nr:flagellar hook-basal body protein [Niallia circulans]KLV26070.1 flagellar basal body rod protein FlgG [Niallia circulans]MCM2981423.1 flagellar hook-basal body protein [Niallia circulans]PAD25940.1 flagellar hook-basal body protein [Niallia circulans]PAD88152.1 flagellar hook-basal body protein [Niallia circulans]PAE12640.1 flagellar hook-basal body protein [Niallia circulans]
MNRTMITASNTLTQLQKQMDLISNNMANVDTTGYKRQNGTFTDMLYQQFNNQKDETQEVNRQTPNGIRQGVGAKMAQTQLVMTQGMIKSSDRVLDTALTKEGQLYRVLVQDGGTSEMRYTRDGAMYLSPVSNNENMLVTKEGHAILDENNNPILLNNNVKEYAFSSTGTLTVQLNNGGQETFNLGISYANNPQSLEKTGENLYRLSDTADENQVMVDLNGGRRNEIAMKQNALEQSNVDISKEMVNLIATQRSYQFQSRSISLADQMMGLVNGIR